MNESTAYQYLSRLNDFKEFIENKYNLGIDTLLIKIKDGNQDTYDLLNDYAAYLKNCNINALTLKQRIVTVKNFLEYHDVDIRKFKVKVKLPKIIRKKKEAISNQDVTNILNICNNLRLRTYVMLLASSGMRATEALSIRLQDLDFDSDHARVFLRENIQKLKQIESSF